MNGTLVSPTPGTPDYSDVTDSAGHGTHVAGIVGAVGNNNIGVVGMSWNVSLHICKASGTDGSFYVPGILDCYSLCQNVSMLMIWLHSALYGSLHCECDPSCCTAFLAGERSRGCCKFRVVLLQPARA